MAFVLSRTSSPNGGLSRDGTHIDSEPVPLAYAPPTPQDHHYDMAKDKEHKPRIEILLDSPYLFLKGVGVDVEPTRLSGHIAIYLTEATPLKEITLQFRGKARLPVPPSESMTMNSAPLSYIVCTHDWSFLEGEKKTSHTLKAGRHLFPFQLRIGGSLPSTISSPAFGGAAVSYKLRAQVVRTGFAFNQTYHAGLPIHIIRSFAHEAMEYQQTLEIENTWPDKLMYSIMVPHKAWAAGDKLTALVKFSPLVKGICVLSVNTSIHEQTKVYARNGAQEQTRVVVSKKHEIVNGRAVEIEDHRTGHSLTHPPSPASPASPPPGFSAANHSHSSSSLSSLSRQYFSHTPLYGITPTASTSSAASTPVIPNTSLPTTASLGASLNRAIDEIVDTPQADSESVDVVTYLSLHVPLTITPTHSLEPITVSHRIRWSIRILNPDGHTSELRCSLPLHLLDYRLLNESRIHSAATRRLLIGEGEVPPAEEEDVQLPSYTQHIRDRVANMFLPESATMRVTNPWVSNGTSPVQPPEGQPSTWPVTRSGHPAPLEAHLLTHLPHQPDPSIMNGPLEYVNCELLLSLTEDAPPRLRTDTPPTSEPLSRTNSRGRSRPGSRGLSRFSSRATSPERTHPHPAAHIPASGTHETYVHGGNASRNMDSIFSTTMKPFSTFAPSGWISSRSSAAPGLHLPESVAELEGAQSVQRLPVHPNPTGAELLHRAFTEVPDYAVASRGFIGGVPPLTSMQGLPSYEETLRVHSDTDVSRRFSQLLVSSDSHVPTSPPPLLVRSTTS